MLLDRRSVVARALRLVALSASVAGLLLPGAAADDRLVELELTIDEGTVDVTGSPAPALTVDGGIPGPTLRFREGDLARIHVHNRLDVESSIHWHGLLVPPGMDGVPYISFPPIAPGATFTYEFPIRQSGTYWYHSHTELQEQEGVYGAIVIEPADGIDEADQADRDHVVLFSDWTDRDPHEVLRDLKRGSEWAAVERGIAQSLWGARREGRLGDYLWRELQRMPPMDIADIAYDRFLANGRSSIELPAAAGETVRLRLVDGSASTVFHVEFAGGPMTVVAADGQDVEPFTLDRLMIAVAETYDVLVTVPAGGSYELRATSHDGSGHASVWLGDGSRRAAPDVPWPNMYITMGKPAARQVFALTPVGTMSMSDDLVESGAFDAPGMRMSHGSMGKGSMEMSAGKGSMEMSAGKGSMEMSAGKGPKDPGSMDHGSMDHGSMDASAQKGSMDQASRADVDPSAFGDDFGWLATDLSSREPLARDGGADRPWSPYDRLRAPRSTALPDDRPVREVRLTLDGDMERYVWFLDQTPLSASDAIKISEGEVVRFRMINRTMMHHPMHLHGHFFRVVNGQGDRAPLKHTVNVEPMSTTVIEFEANEVGDWFFHCHLLYHMKSGMARVVSYQSFTPPPEVRAVRPLLYRDPWYAWSDVTLMSHRSEGTAIAVDTLNTLRAEWEVGWQDVDETETELTLTWERYRNRFFSWFVGVDVEAEGSEVDDPRAILGLRYLIPFGIETQVWVDSDGEAFLGLEKTLHLTPRFALELEAEYETEGGWEESVALEYVLTRRLDLLAQWHSENGVGGGVAIRF